MVADSVSASIAALNPEIRDAARHRSDWRGHTIVCAACGAIADVSPSELPYRKFCSPECRRSVPAKCQASISERFWAKVLKTDSCWVWVGSLNSTGYGQLSNSPRSPRRHPLRAHRVSWEIHFGAIPERLHVLHKCDNPKCVNPDHLFLGDARANALDKVSKGRARGGSLKGEASPQAKLTAAQVASIRLDVRPQRKLAEIYGVSKTTIGCIKRGRSWR